MWTCNNFFQKKKKMTFLKEKNVDKKDMVQS
jgi:hypothetical protein